MRELRKILTGLFLILAYGLKAQMGLVWDKSYNDTLNGNFTAPLEAPTDVIKDQIGHFYIAGNDTKSWVVAKTDSVGRKIWGIKYTGSNDYINYVGSACTPFKIIMLDNYLYVAGSIINSHTGYDAAVIKLDTSGHIVWERFFDNAGSDDNLKGFETDSRNLYLIHTNGGEIKAIKLDTSGVTKFQVTIPSYSLLSLCKLAYKKNQLYIAGSNQTATNLYDLFVTKLDTTGVIKYSYTYSNSCSSLQNFSDLSVNSNGEACIIGTTGTSSLSVLVIKVDSTGATSWLHTYGGTQIGGNNMGSFVVQDSSNNVYAISQLFNNVSNSDIDIKKYSSSGALLWNNIVNLSNSQTEQPRSAILNDLDQLVMSTGEYPGLGDLICYSTTGAVAWTLNCNALIPGSTSGESVQCARKQAQNIICYNGNSGFMNVIVVGLNGGLKTSFKVRKYNFGSQAATAGLLGAQNVIYASGPIGDGQGIGLIKFDQNGNKIWRNSIGLTQGSTDFIAQDSLGNVIIMGTTKTNVNTSTQDVFTAKFDNNGNFLWQNVYSGPGNYTDFDMGLGTDVLGNVYTICAATGTVGGYNSDIIVRKTGSNGSINWTSTFSALASGLEWPYYIDVSDTNNIVVLGGRTGYNYFLKYDHNGNLIDSLTSPSTFYTEKVAKHGGFYYVFGWSAAGGITTWKINTNGQIISAQNMNSPSISIRDVAFGADKSIYMSADDGGVGYVYKLDSLGNFKWQKTMSGNQITGKHLLIDSTQLVYATFNSNNSEGDADVILFQLDSSGTALDTVIYNSYGKDDNTGIYMNGSGKKILLTTGTRFENIIYLTEYCNGPSAPSLFVQHTDTVCKNTTNVTYAVNSMSGVSYSWHYTGNDTQISGSGSAVSLNFGAAATSGTLLCYVQNTCSSSNAKGQVIYVYPYSTISSTTNTICSGGTATLIANGATSYTWSTGALTPQVVISPTVSTTYSVIAVNSLGCLSTAQYSIGVVPVPTVFVSGNNQLCAGNSSVLSATGANTYTWNTGSHAASITVSPGSSTSYSVIGTNQYGCRDTSFMAVQVFPTPTLTILSATTQICSGVPLLMSVTGANTYTWSNGSNTSVTSVSPTSNTTYSVIGSDLNGCVSSTSVSIQVLPIQTVSLTASQTTVCIGTSDSIIASGAQSYVWNTGVTSNSITITPTVTTNYTVTGTDINNCTTTQTVQVTVDTTCADVWPGDANSDGTADNLDILELGLHYTQTGPARTSVSNTWQSYHASNWAGTISNGQNLNHSDCNGDGVIDNSDTLAIYTNYGLIHAFKPVSTTTVNPQLSIVPDQAMVNKGQWATASIYLGSSAAPVNNINGIAFSVEFDHTLIEPNSIWVEYPISFINSTNQNLHFRKPNYANDVFYTATTHTINNNVSGNGKIAILHYQIKNTLVHDTVLNIGLTQGNKSDASGILSPLTTGTSSITAIGASVGVQELTQNPLIAIYPNPARDYIIISGAQPFTKVELKDVTGRTLIVDSSNTTKLNVSVDGLTNGVYFIEVYSQNSVVKRQKIVIQR